MDQWIKFFLNGVIATAKNSRETLQKIILLRKQYEEKIMRLGRKAKIGHKFLLYLFSHPVTSINNAAKNLDTGFAATNRLIADFERVGIIKELTGHSRNRLFELTEYLALFR